MSILEEYYNNSYGEENRFAIDQAHSVEYLTTMHFLKKYLSKECEILDCCAGAGAYSFPLAKDGYKVTAGDLIPHHIELMDAHNDRSILQDTFICNATNMPQCHDAQFDAVLLMGALYHLFEEKERLLCIEECLRVLKPGGILAFSYINRNAVLINHIKRGMIEGEDWKSIIQYGKNGVFYTMDFGEIERLVTPLPLDCLTNIGTDGLIYPLKETLNAMSKDQFSHYMNYHFNTCEQPSILGHSMHGLWIGRKQLI